MTLHAGPVAPGPSVHVETARFPGRRNRAFNVSLTRGELLAAAAFAGSTTPFTGINRSLSEMIWRMSTVDMALEDRALRWKRSDDYTRLDGSEKTSLSYLLGMIQAEALAPRVLGVPHLVHLDAVTRIVYGHVVPKRRPDLLGYSAGGSIQFPLGQARIVVEAKGRSNGFESSAILSALKQLGKDGNPRRMRLPLLLQGLLDPNSRGVASESYFEHPDHRWCAYFRDPTLNVPQEKVLLHDDEFVAVLRTAYLSSALDPLTQLVSFAPEALHQQDDGWTVFTIPEVDVKIAVPDEIWNSRETIQQIDALKVPDQSGAVRPAAIQIALSLAEEVVPTERFVERPLPEGWESATRRLDMAVLPTHTNA